MRGRLSQRLHSLAATEASEQPQDVFRVQSSESSDSDGMDAAISSKAHRFLLWKFVLLAVLCYIDRTSLAFAAIELQADLHFSSAIYGLGASLFFIGYIVWQVPSNLIIVRLGPRIWLGSLAVCWGVIAALFATIKTAAAFYALRIALGFAEAGTMPGMWYACSVFYQPDDLTSAWSLVLVGISASQIVGAPIASLLLKLDGLLDVRGWQWIFIAEGFFTAVFGIFCLLSLPDGPETAAFLTPAERDRVAERSARHKQQNAAGGTTLWQQIMKAVGDYRTWHLTLVLGIGNIPKYAILYWCPLIVNGLLGGRDTHKPEAQGEDKPDSSLVVLLSGLPFALSAALVALNAHHSRHTGERRWHCAIPLAFAACAMLGLALALASGHIVLALLCLLFSTAVWAPDSILASWPATYLTGTAAATGAATINSVASLGGLAGPMLTGFLEQRGSLSIAVFVLSGATFLDALLAALFPSSSGDRPAHHAKEEQVRYAFLGEGARTTSDLEPAVRSEEA
ncbi:hypothetical protein WJX73_008011 [Symbiochloris irregularis]|uniref:Major facilitator superfamily (MFS) profile domain-containing protein n=1 Tax=Symbiochloris irregularis TaxID=706552 RepID=A0AAW1PBQ2_9CHLO